MLKILVDRNIEREATVRPLSHRERNGVRGCGLSIVASPLTRFALDDASHRQEQIDLSFPGAFPGRGDAKGPMSSRRPQLPAFSGVAEPKRTSSRSEDETEGTCSPSEARETATRVLLKAASAPIGLALK